MNPTDDPNESELRDRLRALGGDGEQQAPVFHSVWRSAEQMQAKRDDARRPSSLRWTLAMVTAAAAVCLSAVLWMGHPPRKQHVATVPSASTPAVAVVAVEMPDANTPTDFLLTAANDSHSPSVEQLTREIDALLKP